MTVLIIILILAVLSSLYRTYSLERGLAYQYKERERLEAELSDIRGKIRKLEESKASAQKVSDLWEKNNIKANKTDIEVMSRRISHIEKVVFKDESTDEYLKRENDIYQ